MVDRRPPQILTRNTEDPFKLLDSKRINGVNVYQPSNSPLAKRGVIYPPNVRFEPIGKPHLQEPAPRKSYKPVTPAPMLTYSSQKTIPWYSNDTVSRGHVMYEPSFKRDQRGRYRSSGDIRDLGPADRYLAPREVIKDVKVVRMTNQYDYEPEPILVKQERVSRPQARPVRSGYSAKPTAKKEADCVCCNTSGPARSHSAGDRKARWDGPRRDVSGKCQHW